MNRVALNIAIAIFYYIIYQRLFFNSVFFFYFFLIIDTSIAYSEVLTILGILYIVATYINV